HLVFRAHRRADGDEALLVALVIFVLAVGDDARGRGDRQEGFLDLHVLERRPEIGDVARKLALPGIGDGPDADRVGARRWLLARVELGIELGEFFSVGAALEWTSAGLDRTALEAAQPLERVLRPADGFSELAVADHVNAGLRLLLHHLCHRLGQACLVGSGVERLAILLGTQEDLQLRRPDQAADMRGENAFAAALHKAGWLLGDDGLERDDFIFESSSRSNYSWSMIFSENRCPLFGIML